METLNNALKRKAIQPPWKMIDSAPELEAVEDGWEEEVGEGSIEVVKPVLDTPGEPEFELPVGEARGAVDCPLISLRTEALNVPLMLANLDIRVGFKKRRNENYLDIRELGRERLSRVLRLRGIHKSERGDANKVFVAVRANGWVDSERDCAGL